MHIYKGVKGHSVASKHSKHGKAVQQAKYWMLRYKNKIEAMSSIYMNK